MEVRLTGVGITRRVRNKKGERGITKPYAYILTHGINNVFVGWSVRRLRCGPIYGSICLCVHRKQPIDAILCCARKLVASTYMINAEMMFSTTNLSAHDWLIYTARSAQTARDP